eukprot:COSAG01_NODE_40168_length_466_cov_102.940054_1_plen_66_part_10
MRISGIHKGGLVDRYNRKLGLRVVKVGMVLSSISSPYKAKVSTKNLPLIEVLKLLHQAAPGISFKD